MFRADSAVFFTLFSRVPDDTYRLSVFGDYADPSHGVWQGRLSVLRGKTEVEFREELFDDAHLPRGCGWLVRRCNGQLITQPIVTLLDYFIQRVVGVCDTQLARSIFLDADVPEHDVYRHLGDIRV